MPGIWMSSSTFPNCRIAAVGANGKSMIRYYADTRGASDSGDPHRRAATLLGKNVPCAVKVPEKQEHDRPLLPRHLKAHKARPGQGGSTESGHARRRCLGWPEPFLHQR